MPAPETLSADIAIVGAGAAGITLALELQGSGRSVCLLESGSQRANPETQKLYDMEYVGYPHRAGYYPRLRMLGGSTSIWAGRSMLLQSIDFDGPSSSIYGGWPIEFREIDEHLEAAGQYLGLPAKKNFDIAVHRSKLTPAEATILSQGELAPAISLWAVRPKRFGEIYEKELARAPGVQLFLNANVTGLRTNERGDAIEGLTVASLDGRTCIVRAQAYVIACGGIETPRLLLNSPGPQGEGLGNSRGHVGRFFMDHPRAVRGRAVLNPGVELNLSRGLPIASGKVQLGFRMSDEFIRRHGLLNHYCTFEEETSGYVQQSYQPFVEVMKVLIGKGHRGNRWNLAHALRTKTNESLIYLLSPKEIMPHWLYRTITTAKRRFPRKRQSRRYAIVYFCEQPPSATSRITLADTVDRLGMRRVRFDWQIDEAVARNICVLEDCIDSALRSNNLGVVARDDGPFQYNDASHHLGTARMSVDPCNGVVDADCRVHTVSNLFIAGGAVFPTGGHANPTLTVVSLTIRLAKHLKQLLAR